MDRLDDVEQPEYQYSDRAGGGHQGDERAQPPRPEPAERRQTPAHDQDEPQTFQETAERLGRRKGERGALLAQDAVVGVELGQTAQRLRGRQTGADPEGPEADRRASDEA